MILVAGAATAESSRTHERPDNAVPASSAQTAEVKASTVYLNNKELARAGLKPNDKVEVTIIPSMGIVDRPSRVG
jgi:hypothetical protein